MGVSFVSVLMWGPLLLGSFFCAAFIPVVSRIAAGPPSITECIGTGGNFGQEKCHPQMRQALNDYPESFNPEQESVFMERALELAKKGIGKTRPNPAVGCVVLDPAGVVVGEGFHPKAGQPHAEVFALREAGDRAIGGTAYVTLEPCNHHGRTPPCVDALLNAGVRRVVAGMVDPDPRTAGGGLRRLAAGGVEVVDLGASALGRACRALNAPFSHRILRGTVHGTAHCAVGRGGLAYAGAPPLPRAHPSYAEADALAVEGTAAGLARLRALEEEGAAPLPRTLVRVLLVEEEDPGGAAAVGAFLADLAQGRAAGAPSPAAAEREGEGEEEEGPLYLVLCKRGAQAPAVLARWAAPLPAGAGRVEAAELEDLSARGVAEEGRARGWLALAWDVAPARTKEVVEAGLAQRLCLYSATGGGGAGAEGAEGGQADARRRLGDVACWLLGGAWGGGLGFLEGEGSEEETCGDDNSNSIGSSSEFRLVGDDVLVLEMTI